MKHDYDGACKPGGFFRYSTFSVGIFELVPKASGKGTKRGKVKVRVSGPTESPELVYTKAAEIAALLDAGKYTGPRHVKVSP